MICRKYFVSGRVQGVSYREAIRKKAEVIAVQGHAFNLSDGRVEVLLCGSNQQLEQMIHYLWEGSTYSSISDVQCIEIECQPPGGFITG